VNLLYLEGYTGSEGQYFDDLYKCLLWSEREAERQLEAEEGGEEAGAPRQKYRAWEVIHLTTVVEFVSPFSHHSPLDRADPLLSLASLSAVSTIVKTPKVYKAKDLAVALTKVSREGDVKTRMDAHNFLRRDAEMIAAELVGVRLSPFLSAASADRSSYPFEQRGLAYHKYLTDSTLRHVNPTNVLALATGQVFQVGSTPSTISPPPLTKT